jgi:hypothetical protein
MDPTTNLMLAVNRQIEANGQETLTRLGTIDPDYSGSPNFLPRVQFDGEDVVAEEGFTFLEPYQPAAGDRVLLLRTGKTWVILGEIRTSAEEGGVPTGSIQATMASISPQGWLLLTISKG